MSGRPTLTLSLAKQSPALQRVLDATRAAPIPAPATKAAAPAPKAVVAAAPAAVPKPKVEKAPRQEKPAPFVHAEADPETAAWNRAREAEWHAAHPPAPPPPPPLHQPADEATRLWNQEREAEWHAAPAAVEAALRDLCPATFRDPWPARTYMPADFRAPASPNNQHHRRDRMMRELRPLM
jgi:hypothetical protein